MAEASTSEAETAAESEYDRFRDLSDRLLKVPKKELDEARERERLAKG